MSTVVKNVPIHYCTFALQFHYEDLKIRAPLEADMRTPKGTRTPIWETLANFSAACALLLRSVEFK